MGVTLLFCIVAYGNRDRVGEFVRHCAKTVPGSIGFAICDNTPLDVDEAGALDPGLNTDQPPVVIVDRPDNPGYLEGALVAREAFQERYGPARWFVLSNTDLSFQDAGGLAHLDSTPDDRILAPRITELGTNREMNPHLSERRTNRRVRLDSRLTSTTLVAAAYIQVHRIAARFRAAKTAGPAEAGTKMSQPYGAMVLIPNRFVELLPRMVPLLAEEFVIAEMAEKHGIAIEYFPAAHVIHDAHSVMGMQSTLRSAKLLSRAFSYCERIRISP